MSVSRLLPAPDLRRELSAAFAGYCGMLVTMGVARFAFTPLIPALIAEGWFVSAETFLIGVAIVIGYFIGAIFITRRAGTPHAVAWVRGAMLVVTVAFFLCARPLPFVWFIAWMALAGAASGVGLILSAQVVLAVAAKARHGLIGGIVIAGIGSGIIVSGIIVSLFAEQSLSQTWYCFAGFSAVLTLISWRLWPRSAPLDKAGLENTGVENTELKNTELENTKLEKTELEKKSQITAEQSASHPAATEQLRRTPEPFLLPLSVYATYLSYGLGSFSIAFPQLLFPDFIVRGKGFSLSDAGDLWLITGIGAVTGSLLIGALGDRFGMVRCYRYCLLLFGLAVLALILPLGLGALMVLSLLMGIFNFGQVPMIVGRLRRIFADDEAAARRAWGIASLTFALGQVSGMLLFALLLEATNNYTLLCCLAASLSLTGAMVEFIVRRVVSHRALH